MLESKSWELSLLRLPGDLLRFAPDVAARFRIMGEDAATTAGFYFVVADRHLPDLWTCKTVGWAKGSAIRRRTFRGEVVGVPRA